VQLFTEMLGSDHYALERAGDYWRSAMRALARRHAEGYRTDVSGVMIAKLCALRVLSPGLFDAVRFDAPALTVLERRARAQNLADAGGDEWAEALTCNPRLVRLFTAAPSFIGMETRHLATALRLVHTGDGEPEGRPGSPADAPAAGETKIFGAPAPTTVTPTLAHPPARLGGQKFNRRAKLAEPTSPIWSLAAAAASTFIADRLVKIVVESVEGFQTGTTIFGGLVRLQPSAEIGLMNNSLAVGAELIGLALCILIAVFSAKQVAGVRERAFGLIAGGLAAGLFDRLMFGAPMNYLHIANLPVFNLAHVALLVGTLLLTYAVLTDSGRRAGDRDTGNLAHE
jgi:lipoprotein signal peptidase